MGSLKKGLSSITDMVGLTDTKSLEAQQRQYEEQQKQLAAQAQLDADTSAENINTVDSGGAAGASADAITASQKKRRAGAVSTALGI
ncbi:hypothetical protein [Enterobacter phage SDFMU_Pec]|uniref:Uncharacterized protein n=1 Tax=Enterobacter phage SDFMU_Pec TaxID=3076136 RepID=A0AA96QY24_9CAUD|nr:hypothetical protein [Enterobacter phage SDFMU_Pec]